MTDIKPIQQLDIERLIKEKGGIMLDLGCGRNKQKGGFIGMDRRPTPETDIVHDLEVFPWPLPNECCITVVASHIIEHIKPWLTVDFMNEIWRITKIGGRLAISAPFGVSTGYLQDPTHCNQIVAQTFKYFEYGHWAFNIYAPRPWKILPGFPVWMANGNIECLLEKIADSRTHEQFLAGEVIDNGQ